MKHLPVLFFVLVVALVVASCASTVPIFTPSSIAVAFSTPTWLADLPVGMLAVLNKDGSWSVGNISPSNSQERPLMTPGRINVFRAPTLDKLVVPAGEGGPLPDYTQPYYNVMENAKVEAAQKAGIDPNKVATRYWDNKGSQDAFGWMLYYQIDGGGVIWPLKQDGALADYPAYFAGQVQPDGSLKNLKIDSDYDRWVVAGGQNAAAIFGGTLPVIVDDPINGVYSRWFRPGGEPADYAQDFTQWQNTPGISVSTDTPTLTETPVETPIATEQAQAEPGTTVLDSEYNLDGRVAINSENSKPFYSYLADAFWRINKDYFVELGVTNSIDAQKYMQNNTLPIAFNYPVSWMGTNSDIVILRTATTPVDFKKLSINLVNYKQYAAGFPVKTLVPMYSSPPNSLAMLAGFSLIEEGNSSVSKLVIDIVQTEQNVGVGLGFPDSNGDFDESKLGELDNYVRVLGYSLRGMDYSEPVKLCSTTSPDYLEIKSCSGWIKPSINRKIFTSVGLSGVLRDNLDKQFDDFPPQILKIGNK